MKRLLLLFVPLVFFFSCEKDNPGANVAHSNTQSNNNDSEDCHCGEAVNIVSYAGFGGDLVVDINDSDLDGDTTDTVLEGMIPAWEYTEIENNCTGDTMSVCEILEIGETFCGTILEGDDYDCECRYWYQIEFECVTEITDDAGNVVDFDVISDAIGYEFIESTNEQMATSVFPLSDECISLPPVEITSLSGTLD